MNQEVAGPIETINSEDYDCTICRCPMKVKFFIKNQDSLLDELEEDSIRFKCGHAFHSGCACLSLRNSDKCPTCRDSQRSIFDSNNIEQDIQDELEDITSPLIAQGIKASEILALCGKKQEVQSARRKLNKVIKEYSHFEHETKKKRREVLCKTLKKFKDTYHEEYILKFNKVKKFARALEHIELKISKEIEPTEDLRMFLSYDPRDLINRDLLRRNFWNY